MVLEKVFPEKKKRGRKQIPQNDKLIPITFWLTKAELADLERYKKENSFKNISATVRKLVKDVIYPRAIYLPISNEKIKEYLASQKDNEIDDETMNKIIDEIRDDMKKKP